MKSIKDSPALIITDTKGKILTVNEAAHNICATLSPGGNIEDSFSAEAARRYHTLLSEGALSFTLPDALGCETVFFDLTKERTEGVRTLYLSGRQIKIKASVDYDRVAETFKALIDGEGFLGKRRFTELYDTLTSDGCIFGSNRNRQFYPAAFLADRFFGSVLPRLLYTVGDVIFTPSPSFNENSIIFAEPYGFYLLMCATVATASHVSVGHVHVSARDTGDKVIFTVTAPVDGGKRYERAADFGVRALDLLYAGSISSVSGYSFSYESQGDRVTFTVAFNSHDYYPSYLKTDAAARFFIASVAESVYYPASAEEEDNEKQ